MTVCGSTLLLPRRLKDGPYPVSSSIWPVHHESSGGEGGRGCRDIDPGYVLEPAPPGMARRAVGRPSVTEPPITNHPGTKGS